MKKIGILSHYWNSTNYGGLLQAFALVRAFEKRGFAVEQIQYNSSIRDRPFHKKVLSFLRQLLTGFVRHRTISIRQKSCSDFREKIPHSHIVYTYKNIKNANALYDAFVTGSDQVWHPFAFNAAYSLSFSNKPKFSYAASVASSSIPGEIFSRYEKDLSELEKVSVRERKAIELLNFRRDIQLVLDPVFMLSADEWEAVAAEEKVKGDYMFCYFLGSDEPFMQTIELIARAKCCKVISIPYVNGKKASVLSEAIRANVTPEYFLSLIRNAKCVFTDSFHAICFSYIFKKDFYVFARNKGEHMLSRITDILYTLNCEDRLVNGVFSYEHIDFEALNKTEFERLYEESNAFLDAVSEAIENEN